MISIKCGTGCKTVMAQLNPQMHIRYLYLVYIEDCRQKVITAFSKKVISRNFRAQDVFTPLILISVEKKCSINFEYRTANIQRLA